MNVESSIVSPTIKEINSKEIKGEIKMRFATCDALVLSFMALSHNTNVKPISNTPTYTEPKIPYKFTSNGAEKNKAHRIRTFNAYTMGFN